MAHHPLATQAGALADGRAERAARTHQGILEAARALILAGANEPTAKEVAEAAGVTARTLFRHFADMDMLYRSLIEQAELGALLIMDEPFPQAPAENWRAMLSAVVERRCRVYESLLPLYVSPIWSRDRAGASKPHRQRGVKRRRQRLKDVLPEEIRRDAVLFEAIDGVLSIDYWVSLRTSQNLGVEAAHKVLTLAAERLVGAGDGDQG